MNSRLRLGMRQVDGMREDDAKAIVSIRDGIPAELNPHLFCPPYLSCHHTGLSRKIRSLRRPGVLDRPPTRA